MTIAKYEEKYFLALHRCFNQVFSSSQSRLKLSEEHFAIRLNHKLNIAPQYSRLLISKEQVVGFVLQTTNRFQGKKMLYNGGTGVIGKFQNQGYGQKLLTAALGVAPKDVALSVLEVIDSNEPGLRLYEGLAFRPTRILNCFKRRSTPTSSVNGDVSFEKRSVDELSALSGADDLETSFIDSWDQLRYNQENEIGLRASLEGRVVGYVVFQPHLGRISRMGVVKQERGQGIGSAILKRVQEVCRDRLLTIMNIPADQPEMLAFLSKKGFVHEITQIEMIKNLDE